MATIQASTVFRSWSSSSCRSSMIMATINAPKIRISSLPFPKLYDRGYLEDLSIKGDYKISTTTTTLVDNEFTTRDSKNKNNSSDPMVIAKLYAIMESVADRVEMHNNIGEQRNNWNHLLLSSINAITLTAATMCGLAAMSASGEPFKVSSTILYLAATGMLAIMNKIQPSQLAEEQRNAARLFKQLQGQIHTMISIGNPTIADVKEAMEKVLALDRAYPLPLLGAMLDKFPSEVEPAVWWPQQRQKQAKGSNGNGWNAVLEDEMRRIVGIVKSKDKADYLRLGKKALRLNKILAISGPALTGVAALGSALVGTHPWAAMVGVVAGALASVVNAVEHGGQVGMVFEMYRSNAGFFKLMEETIESNINEKNIDNRENGEIMEMKVALHLGRSLSELKNLTSRREEAREEFASKLF